MVAVVLELYAGGAGSTEVRGLLISSFVVRTSPSPRFEIQDN